MKDWTANDHDLHLARTELVPGLVDMLCDAEQNVEEGHEGGFVWMDHQAYRQVRLTVGLIQSQAISGQVA